MITANIIVFLLFAHFISDFVLQTNTMALNKSKDLGWLSIHIAAYTLSLAVFMTIGVFLFDFNRLFIVKYCLLNGVIHFGVDFITSKITSHYWQKKKTHEFFVVVGLDQFIHAISLIYTFIYLNN